MRNIELALMLALTAALTLPSMAAAQPPDQRQIPLRDLVRPTPISMDDIVERIMAFDRNKDGKITKDELPERMQFLIELGDTNNDGALDRDEIKKLVATRAAARGGFGTGGFAIGGFGPGPVNIRSATRVGFGPGPGPGLIEEVVDDLKLSAKKKEQALAAVKAHEENVRKLMDQARAQLLQKMKEILSDEELQDFKAALDRPRGGTVIVDVPKPGAVERKIDQLQKELEDLRRELRR